MLCKIILLYLYISEDHSELLSSDMRYIVRDIKYRDLETFKIKISLVRF